MQTTKSNATNNMRDAAALILANNFKKMKTEKEIYNLYNEYVLADLQKVRNKMSESIQHLKHSNSIELDEVMQMRLSNRQLRAIVRKY